MGKSVPQDQNSFRSSPAKLPSHQSSPPGSFLFPPFPLSPSPFSHVLPVSNLFTLRLSRFVRFPPASQNVASLWSRVKSNGFAIFSLVCLVLICARLYYISGTSVALARRFRSFLVVLARLVFLCSFLTSLLISDHSVPLSWFR